MSIVNVHEAKTNFSKLLERAAQGERIIIGKAGKPVARLEPFSGTKAVHRQFTGGNLRLQANSKKTLTPEYLNELADSKHGK